MIDLIENRAVVWYDDETLGVNYELTDIPAELEEEVMEWRGKLVEAVAETNDTLLERYLDDPDSITPDEMREAIRKATIDMSVVPVFCGSAFKNKGIQRLLDAVVAFLPSPLDIGAVTGFNPYTSKEENRNPDSGEPLTALAFKIATDPFVGRLVFLRIYSGVLKSGVQVMNVRTGKKDRISRLYQMHANKQNPKEEVGAGDICGAVGLKNVKTGDTLCDPKHPISLESMEFPEPVIGVAIEPKTQSDIDKLGIALGKLAEEDPTFQVNFDENTGQTVISGMGELHLDILVDRLRREFKLECNVGAPQVAYKEAITATVEHREVLKSKQAAKGNLPISWCGFLRPMKT